MNADQLEAADRIIRECEFTGISLKEGFAFYGRPKEEAELVEHLVGDGQFHVLLDLKRAERYALLALDRLGAQTQYLKEELEVHLLSLRSLLEKIEREEHLRRDREALHVDYGQRSDDG